MVNLCRHHHDPCNSWPSELLVSLQEEYGLSQRELDVLASLFNGYPTAKHIARRLKLSHRTIEGHLKSIRTKFKCSTMIELVIKALKFLQTTTI